MYGSCRGKLRRSRHFPCERRQMSNEETSVSVRRSNDQVAMFARRAKITLRDAGDVTEHVGRCATRICQVIFFARVIKDHRVA